MSTETQAIEALAAKRSNSVNTIYVASRASIPERAAMWRRLRDEDGFDIISTWIDEAGDGETGDFTELWERISDEVAMADKVVLYAESDDFPLKGAFIEVGMAIGMGKPVIVCLPGLTLEGRSSRPIGSWISHPLVTRIDDLRTALSAELRPLVPAVPKGQSVGGRVAMLKPFGHQWLIVQSTATWVHLTRSGEWTTTAIISDDFHPAREAAQAFLTAHADPAPPPPSFDETLKGFRSDVFEYLDTGRYVGNSNGAGRVADNIEKCARKWFGDYATPPADESDQRYAAAESLLEDLGRDEEVGRLKREVEELRRLLKPKPGETLEQVVRDLLERNRIGGQFQELAGEKAAQIEELRAQLEAAGKELPGTFYADRDLPFRLEMLVIQWRNLIEAQRELEICRSQLSTAQAENRQLREQGGIPRTLAEFCAQELPEIEKEFGAYFEHNGADHEDEDCPEDSDGCECPLVRGVNRAFGRIKVLLQALKALPSPAAPVAAPADETHEERINRVIAQATKEVEAQPAWMQKILRDSASPTVSVPRVPVANDIPVPFPAPAEREASVGRLEKIKPNPLNHDHDEARSLHRIVRAMHDGECPRCHGISAATEMWTERVIMSLPFVGAVPPSGWQCPMCDFYITEAEGESVLKIFAPFMERNLAVFEKWRAERNGEPAVVASPEREASEGRLEALKKLARRIIQGQYGPTIAQVEVEELTPYQIMTIIDGDLRKEAKEALAAAQ